MKVKSMRSCTALLMAACATVLGAHLAGATETVPGVC
jgi:hypothetical protein